MFNGGSVKEEMAKREREGEKKGEELTNCRETFDSTSSLLLCSGQASGQEVTSANTCPTLTSL